MIMRPSEGWVIAYRTSNRLDLRRANLWLGRGRAPGQALKVGKGMKTEGKA